MSEELAIKVPPISAATDAEVVFTIAAREAAALAKSGLLPEAISNTSMAMQVVQMARETGQPPFMLAQNIYVVHGRIGLSAAYLIGLANRHPKIATNLRWREVGTWPNTTITCIGRLRGEEEDRTVSISMEDAKEAGWTKNQQYKTRLSALHMLKFRSATWWVRENVPEVLMGMHTVDELEDISTANPPPRRAAPDPLGILDRPQIEQTADEPSAPPTASAITVTAEPTAADLLAECEALEARNGWDAAQAATARKSVGLIGPANTWTAKALATYRDKLEDGTGGA